MDSTAAFSGQKLNSPFFEIAPFARALQSHRPLHRKRESQHHVSG
jgi:hypothetical protein